VLTIEVAHSGELVAGATRACVGPLGRALALGLPEEFATATLAGILEQADSLPAGELRVDAAGYDDADSSAFSFARAGGVLAFIIAAAVTDALGAETVAAAIERCC
jgi:hypothetical protein